MASSVTDYRVQLGEGTPIDDPVVDAGTDVALLDPLDVDVLEERMDALTANRSECAMLNALTAGALGQYHCEIEGWFADAPGRCEELMSWRANLGFSYRAIAARAHASWGGSWSPPSNQIMGVALVEYAAGLTF